MIDNQYKMLENIRYKRKNTDNTRNDEEKRISRRLRQNNQIIENKLNQVMRKKRRKISNEENQSHR
jgi:hypothetical protein